MESAKARFTNLGGVGSEAERRVLEQGIPGSIHKYLSTTSTRHISTNLTI
jgi:hypothetical protein